MITLHTWKTQNARKISIMLEECNLPYQINPIDIENNQQFDPEFLELNPNAKIPVITDSELIDGNGNEIPIFESGAILLYLAEKTGLFLGNSPSQQVDVIKWLFWQTSSLGPNLGNFSHFSAALVQDPKLLNNYLNITKATEPNQYAIQRFTKESLRLLGILNVQLKDREYVANTLSIADFAIYPWVESAWLGLKAINPKLEDDFSNIYAWMNKLNARKGVKQGMEKLAWTSSLF